MTNRKDAVREHVAAYRVRRGKLGLRQISLWVPDTRAPEFAKECRRQSRLAAAERFDPIDDLLLAAAGSVQGWE